MTLHQIKKFKNINHEFCKRETLDHECCPLTAQQVSCMDALAATLARHGAYKKFPQRLLDREAIRRAKRYARRKVMWQAFEIELDELPF